MHNSYMKKLKIIGISGISGAGKSTLVKSLSKKLQATSIFWDEFDEISTSPTDYVAWYKRGGDYNEFNYEALAKVLASLKKGNCTKHPVTENILEPTEYIIVDAPLGKAHKQTSQFIDYFIHLDTPLDIALARRLQRDIRTQGLSLDDVKNILDDYLNKSRELFTPECMCTIINTANLVIDGTEPTQKQVEHILVFLSPQAPDAQNIIQMVEEIDEEVEEKVRKGFMEYETENNIDVNYKKFSLVLSDPQKNILGVLNAYTAFAEIYVDDIWVDSDYRNHGYGKQLLMELEKRFEGKGFNNINLCTSDFQAPEFYKKCGYMKEFTRINHKNPKLSKSFFVKYFSDTEQTQGILSN